MIHDLTLSVQMHCDTCENGLRTALQRAEGVIRVEADHRRDEVRLRFDAQRVTEEQIRERVRGAGFEPA